MVDLSLVQWERHEKTGPLIGVAHPLSVKLPQGLREFLYGS